MNDPFPLTRLRFDDVESTNTLARQYADSPGSLLITATHQTRGRGRRGAVWFDVPGTAALMTYVIEAPFGISDAWKLSFVASVAAQQACWRATGAAIQVMWPNDIVCGSHKLGGILIETMVPSPSRWTALIGIGINVGNAEFDSGDEFVLHPTSLKEISIGGEPTVEDVIGNVSEALGPLIDRCANADGFGSIMSEWRKYLAVGYIQPGLDDAGDPISGVLEDVDLVTGCGLLRLADGTLASARPVERGVNA